MSSPSATPLSRSRRATTLIVLGMLAGLGPFTIDLYLPAFPQLKAEFDTSEAMVQLTLSATTLGFALGQLIVGPISDRVGRRRPLLIATTVHVCASVGVALAADIGVMLMLRVMQGFGAAAGSVVAAAMVRDLFSGSQLVTALSRLALVIGIAPIVAPAAGSWLLGVVAWRGLFWVLAAYAGLVIALQLLFLRETLPSRLRVARGHSTLVERYRAVLTDRIFIGVAMIGAGIFGGTFTYLSTSSFLLQEVYGFSAEQFGVTLALLALPVLIGSQTAGFAARRAGAPRVLIVATALLVLGGAGVVVSAVSAVGVAGLLLSIALFALAFGLCMPCVQALALMEHGREAGTAASLLGAANMSIAGLIVPIAGLFRTQSALPLGLVMLLCGLIALSSLWLVVRPLGIRRRS